MSIIFEISEIHLLADIDRNGSLEWEFRRSKLIARSGRTPTLSSRYEWGRTPRGACLPVRVFIRIGRHKDTSSIRRRECIVYYHDSSDPSFQTRLSEKLGWAKIQAERTMSMAIKWAAKKNTVFSFMGDELRRTVVTMTEMARSIAEDNNMDAALQLAERFAKKDLDDGERLRLTNERELWYRDVYAGRISLPTSFWERQRILAEHFETAMADELDIRLARSLFMRALIGLGAAHLAFRLRKYASDT